MTDFLNFILIVFPPKKRYNASVNTEKKDTYTEGIIMKKNWIKNGLCVLLATAISFQSLVTAYADSSKIVTLGANLSKEQKEKMFEYFGVSSDEVEVIEVNNQEERKYLEGIATEQEIGTRTYSCAYIMPTSEKKINVKTANLTWVSTSMIANTLVTAGINSCDVVAASPIEVSGTGALTGIMKAYETATEASLDEEKKNLAMEELYNTAQLADSVGQEEAAAVINEVKDKVIKDNVTDTEQLNSIVEQAANDFQVSIPEEQQEKIVSLMAKIGAQDYDYNSIKDTMENVKDKIINSIDSLSEDTKEALKNETKGFLEQIADFFVGIFKAIGDFFAGLFGGNNTNDPTPTASPDPDVSDNSIINNIDDSILGSPATTAPSSDTKNDLNNNVQTDSFTAAPENTPDTTEPADMDTPDTTDNQSEQSELDTTQPPEATDPLTE